MSMARSLFGVAGVASIALGTMCLGFARVQAAENDVAPPVAHISAIPDSEYRYNEKTTNYVKLVYSGEAGTISAVTVGDLKRHVHNTASEMFYVVEGSAQITVGDVKESIKAGDLMIVPKGVPHSIKSDKGRLKTLLITMPPRNPDDVHFMN
jgi:mannose-6-phosphate isomerase-like protein (cupin superfamily)